MSEVDEFSQLDDPAFLAERRRVREELGRLPEHEQDPEAVARSRRLDDEFIRRASAAWAAGGSQ